MNPTSLGARLREERLRLRLSQRAFSEICGLDESTQISYEQGRSTPKLSYYNSLVDIGADANYITTGQRTGDSKAPLTAADIRRTYSLLDMLARATASGDPELAIEYLRRYQLAPHIKCKECRQPRAPWITELADLLDRLVVMQMRTVVAFEPSDRGDTATARNLPKQ